ncbi:GDT1-like protein 4 isoform X2 [Asparagus officinalis]|uniref:GDT1-like protein 4 isoform X2 n=1 Tax=Asparagus officinalis TaxID=4686 RepID=UPI00098E6C64|nr:GDT1-like protein 4 isoform X2 [Asparagus officinalis]
MDLTVADSRFRFLHVAFFLLILVVSASSQGLELETAENASVESTTRPLDRRTKMFLHAVKKKVSKSKESVLDLGETGLGIFDAFFASFSMILVSEIGDETFIIAALMAMRHPKSTVLSGALSALVVMTVLSTGLGRIVPNLISRKHTNSAATVLYAFFGLRLLYIAWRSDSKASQKKEIEEVEEKLETGQGKSTHRRFLSRFCTPIFLELATHKNAVGVAVGATIGHTICTSLAVIGGSMLASKISQATVATIGGLLFLGFSLSSYFYPPL